MLLAGVVVALAAITGAALLHEARPVLLNFGEPGNIEIAPWADRVQLVDTSYDATWELPVIGVVSPPTAVLVRPDGYVACAAKSDNLAVIADYLDAIDVAKAVAA